MSESNELGTMYAIMGFSLEEISKYIEGYDDKVSIANINLKSQIVLSGYTEEMKLIADKLEKIDDVKVKQLNVSSAFHSPFMKVAETIMRKEIMLKNFNEPHIRNNFKTKEGIISLQNTLKLGLRIVPKRRGMKKQDIHRDKN